MTEDIVQCPECEGRMTRGCLTSVVRVHWTPFPSELKKFRIRLTRPCRVFGWSCSDCGLITLRVQKTHKKSGRVETWRGGVRIGE